MSYANIQNDKLRMCRGCLAMDVRLYEMRRNRLMEAYTRLTQVTDDLPHYLCSYCAALLLKCDAFRNKCIDAQTLFRNLQLDNVQINFQQINTQCNPYKQTDTLILNIDEIDTNNDSKDLLIHPTDNMNDSFDSQSINEHDYTIIEPFNSKTVTEPPIGDDNDYFIIKTEAGYLLKDGNDILKLFNGNTNGEVPKVTSKGQSRDEINHKIKAKDLDDITEMGKQIKRRHSKFTKKELEKLSEDYNMDFKYLKTKEEQHMNFNEILNNRKKSENYILGVYKCDICYKGFVISDAYNKHMTLHNKSINSKFYCDICNLYFNNKHSYQGHTTRHSRRFACRQCEYTTDVKESARDHYLWHGGFKYSCKLCDKKLNGRSSYYVHLKMVHPTSDELIRCEMCGDSFCGPTGIKQHERMAHKEVKSPECHCSGCDTQFYCSDAFKAHQGTDGLCDTTYKYCVRCGMSFETEQLLKEHEIDQRKPRDEFKCEVCAKVLKNYPAYSVHRKIHYSNSELIQYRLRYTKNKLYTGVGKCKRTKLSDEVPETKFICELCGIIYKTKLGLRMHHNNIHTNVRPYECTVCKKAFKTTTSLKFHSRVHTGERPFQCEICPKAFKCCTNLSRHKRVHTGERPFSCDVCRKSFQTKHCVQMHVKTVHMKVPMPTRIRQRKKKSE